MEDKDQIKELFKNQFDGFEAKVRPDLWNSISSQIPAAASSSVVASPALVKSLIIGASAAVIGLTVYVFTPSDTTDKQVEKTIQQADRTNSKHRKDATQDQPTEQTAPFKNNTENVDPIRIEEVQGTLTDQIVNVVERAVQKETSTFSEGVENKVDNETNVKEVPVHLEVPNQNESAKTQENTNLVEEDKTYTLGSAVNVFTPNGDGTNDYFELPSSGLEEFTIVVLDNRNKSIFISADPQFKWDGTYTSGEQVPSGSYMYFLTARDKQGNPVTQSSYLRIVR